MSRGGGHSLENVQDGNQGPLQPWKDFYRMRRDEFRIRYKDISEEELYKWKHHDHGHEYTYLRGFVPGRVVGDNFKSNKEGPKYRKADTFFSEYKLHNEESYILSESPETSRSPGSYIIGILYSCDRRQYPDWYMKMKNPNFVRGPNGEGGGEGQGFGHCLVIPKKRIFNVVDPEATANNCSVLKELRDHWKKFWREGGADKILWRTRKAVCDQEIELVAMRDQANEKHKEQYYDSKVTQEVLEDFKEMGKEFRRLGVEDFLYGFHLFPDSTVAHLHMHVFPKHEEYRRFSTHAHDPKTVPLQAILDAESEDQSEAQVEEDETALAQHEEN